MLATPPFIYYNSKKTQNLCILQNKDLSLQRIKTLFY